MGRHSGDVLMAAPWRYLPCDGCCFEDCDFWATEPPKCIAATIAGTVQGTDKCLECESFDRTIDLSGGPCEWSGSICNEDYPQIFPESYIYWNYGWGGYYGPTLRLEVLRKSDGYYLHAGFLEGGLVGRRWIAKLGEEKPKASVIDGLVLERDPDDLPSVDANDVCDFSISTITLQSKSEEDCTPGTECIEPPSGTERCCAGGTPECISVQVNGIASTGENYLGCENLNGGYACNRIDDDSCLWVSSLCDLGEFYPVNHYGWDAFGAIRVWLYRGVSSALKHPRWPQGTRHWVVFAQIGAELNTIGTRLTWFYEFEETIDDCEYLPCEKLVGVTLHEMDPSRPAGKCLDCTTSGSTVTITSISPDPCANAKTEQCLPSTAATGCECFDPRHYLQLLPGEKFRIPSHVRVRFEDIRPIGYSCGICGRTMVEDPEDPSKFIITDRLHDLQSTYILTHIDGLSCAWKIELDPSPQPNSCLLREIVVTAWVDTDFYTGEIVAGISLDMWFSSYDANGNLQTIPGGSSIYVYPIMQFRGSGLTGAVKLPCSDRPYFVAGLYFTPESIQGEILLNDYLIGCPPCRATPYVSFIFDE